MTSPLEPATAEPVEPPAQLPSELSSELPAQPPFVPAEFPVPAEPPSVPAEPPSVPVEPAEPTVIRAARDLADVPAAEVVAAAAVHLLSAAAVKVGLGEEGPQAQDLDEARKLITALAGLVTAAVPDLGVHAAPLRDGLQALQRAFREASREPDAPGDGPGERLTGAV